MSRTCMTWASGTTLSMCLCATTHLAIAKMTSPSPNGNDMPGRIKYKGGSFLWVDYLVLENLYLFQDGCHRLLYDISMRLGRFWAFERGLSIIHNSIHSWCSCLHASRPHAGRRRRKRLPSATVVVTSIPWYYPQVESASILNVCSTLPPLCANSISPFRGTV
jgi:hypothetical protein